MRRPSAKTLRLVAVTAASAAVAACGLSSTSNNTLLAGPTGQPVTVGISLPLFGKDQAGGFAPDGQACKKGYELWASDVNSHGGLLGRPVKLIILNDAGDPPTDAKNYRTLITKDHVDLTLAPFSSLLVSQAAALVTKHYGYALAAGSAGAPAVYALNDRDLFADPPVTTAEKYLRQHGVQTVYANFKKPYPATIGTHGLEAAAQVVAKTHPDIVFLGSIAVSTVQAFMAEFAKLPSPPKYFIASSGPDQGTSFISAVGTGPAVGTMVPNGWFGGYPNALSHVMVQDYIAKYGGTAADINADVAESYSAGQVEAAAVTATNSLSQQAIINWLHKPTTTVQTVLGPVQFNNSGRNTLIAPSALIFQWQPGQGGAGLPQFVQVLPNAVGSKNIIPWAG